MRRSPPCVTFAPKPTRTNELAHDGGRPTGRPPFVLGGRRALEIECGRSFLAAGGPLFFDPLLAQRLLEVQEQVVVELERAL